MFVTLNFYKGLVLLEWVWIIAAKLTVSNTTFVFDFIAHGSISDRVDARCNIINTSRDEEVHREGGAVEVLLGVSTIIAFREAPQMKAIINNYLE